MLVSNAVKNLVLGLANAMAAVVFIFFSSVQWSVAAPLALGCLTGDGSVLSWCVTRPLDSCASLVAEGANSV